MAASAAPRQFPYLQLVRQLTAGLTGLAAAGNVYKHHYYLAGIYLVITLTQLLSLIGHRLPPASRRWALLLLGLGWLVALVLLVLHGVA